MSEHGESGAVPATPAEPPPPPPPPPPPRRSSVQDWNPFGEPDDPSTAAVAPPTPPPLPPSPPPPPDEPPQPRSPPPPIPTGHSNGSLSPIVASSAASIPGLDTSGSRHIVEEPTPFSSPLTPQIAGVGAVAAAAVEAAAVTAATGGGPGRILATSSVAKRKALDETRLFESQRSNHFGEKYDGDSLYWKCFVELIRRSQANNRRAINYASKKLAATALYAKNLYAIRDRVDGLDAGTTERRCERERKKRGNKQWPPPPGVLRQSPADSVANVRPPSALDSLFIMDEHTAMRTLDMVDEAKVTVVEKKLNAMVQSLDDRFSKMVGQGTACLRLMHAAETNSKNAYNRYTDVVTQSLNREDRTPGVKSPLMNRDVVSSDVWLADMNYRVAVTQQGRVWKGASDKLGDLFSNMKDIEVERRQAIQDGLAVLVQLQDSLLRDLPVLKDPVLQSLDRINVDRQLIDQEVKHEMRKGAARMRAHRQEEGGAGGVGGSTGASKDGSGSSSVGGGATGRETVAPLPPDFLKGVASPLESKLIARSTMLERRDKGMVSSRWVLVLAILTHDSYLLLFDVPRGCPAHKKQLSARASEAFAELVPKPEVDAMAVEIGKNKEGKLLDANGLPVPPSVAIDLSACQVSFKPDGKNDATFEITEIKPALGMKGMFKTYEESKFTLRGRSQEAMVDWVCEIKEMGRAGFKAVTDSKGG